ncbi:MAG: acyl-[acyl-carrier-protein] thioesterase [Acetivibrionales bacterium]|jgi:medium-chain acyl-[acyl-carrier-protein] hydrolase
MGFKRFTHEFYIHNYETGKHKQATPISILHYLEETALSHTESVGLGIDRMKADGTAWILNRWSVRTNRYPCWKEKIVVETWPSSFRRFYATREFYIKDANENIIVRASSLWVYLNILKKRPLRIPEYFGELYGVTYNLAVENPFKSFHFLLYPTVRKSSQ